VTLAPRVCATVAEERLDLVRECCGIVAVNVADQRLPVGIAVVDDERDGVESVWLAVRGERIGNLVGEIGE
jgi:hypothetical protein